MSDLLIVIYILTLIIFFFFFFNDTATTEIYTLSLHDALPILGVGDSIAHVDEPPQQFAEGDSPLTCATVWPLSAVRSEEHTSELQSLRHLVCRLLLEKKKKANRRYI